MELSDRIALVTGAGQGLGAAIAQRLARAGAAVVVHYRTSHGGAQEVRDSIRAAGGQATIAAADLTRGSEVDRLVSTVTEKHGRVDILVNNAGSYPSSPLLDMTEEEWDAVVDANLKSVHLCTQRVAGVMVEHDGGAIVNVASVEGVTPAPLHAHYTSAKAAVLMHTRAAAQELGPKGIRVNAVSPGLIWREGLEEAWPEGVARWRDTVPLGRLGRPEDVAEACLFLVSPAAAWITGVNLPVDGGILARQVF
ncbi:MAG: 3-oxoacyl-ACP reductase FabG [Acidobacteria bacterium]|nr:3-oxoacyl-ACP reductase FabG [Acidobacteriota bacterium]